MWPPPPARILADVKLLLAICCCLLLPSCLLGRNHVNRPIDAVAYERLAPGTSTVQDVAELLGAPAEVVELGSGSAWRYEYVQSKRTGLWLILIGFLNDDTQSDRVWVFFDAEGRLTHAASTLQADRAEWELPWGSDD